MVMLLSLQTNLHSSACISHSCRPLSSQICLRHLCGIPARHGGAANCNGVFVIRAYMEETNTFSGFASKVIGSLPVIGLLARIVSDEGGVGNDLIDFAEFRRRVGNKCSISDTRAFYEFKDRHGQVGEPLHVLMCCWLAAVGAGLLKSEEILDGMARLRLSNDVEFEEQTFIAAMNEAREKRSKVRGGSAPVIPMEVRVEKAIEAVYVCCFGAVKEVGEEDLRLLPIMLNAVFPTVGMPVLEKMIKEKMKTLAEGGELIKFAEPSALPKEAVQMQLKDLQFLKQMDESTQ